MMDFRRGSSEHARARELAATRADGTLPAMLDAWLEEHLAGCADCSDVAAAYNGQHELFTALRDAAPEPPRDLWARTAAAIEADTAPGRRVPRPFRRAAGFGGFGALRRLPLAPITGLLAVVVVVGVALLNGAPVLPPGDGHGDAGTSPGPTPIVVTAGNVQVLTRASDGSLELSTRQIDEVCPVGAPSCATPTSGDSTKLSTLGDLGSFDAVISPTQDHIVVMQKGATAGGVYVVPVRAVTTPTPSPVATPPPASPTSAASSSPSASMTPATPSPTASADPSIPPSEAPTASPATPPSPTAVAPSASASLEITPRPDGTVEIARDVILVGSTSGYTTDGTRFAFTARPADGSAGPDVFVWQTTDTRARLVTSDHASVFDGWIGDRLLISRVVDGTPVTVLLDPVSGTEQATGGGSMWRPSVAPDGKTAAWWDGTVVPAADGFTWQPGIGRLVLGAWPGAIAEVARAAAALDASPGPDASPSPSPVVVVTPTPPPSSSPAASSGTLDQPLVLTAGTIHDWQVRWDETGTVMALWIADTDASAPGRLSLFAVDPATGAVNLDKPLLRDAPAFEGFSVKSGRLAWKAPAGGGDTTVQVLAWSGDEIGQLELPADPGVVLH